MIISFVVWLSFVFMAVVGLIELLASENDEELIRIVFLSFVTAISLFSFFNRIRQKSPILYRWVMNAVRYEG
ncbi:hypothetical protein ACFSQ5_06610, partial [Enterococcus gallinarum]